MEQIRHYKFVIFLLGLFVLLTPASASTIININGSSCIDNYLTANTPSDNYGSFNYLHVRSGGGDPHVMEKLLISCTLSNIPNHAIINNATLKIYAYKYAIGNPAGRTYQVYTTWDNRTIYETELRSSWNNYNATSAWTNAGGDYGDNPIDSFVVPSSPNVWFNWTVTQAVYNAKNNSINASFIIRDSYNSNFPGDQILFVSRENTSDVILIPQLVVNYTNEETRSLSDVKSINKCLTDSFFLSNQCKNVVVVVMKDSVNWYTMLGAYISSILTLFMLNFIIKKKRVILDAGINGTIVIIASLACNLMGFNIVFLFNYLFNSSLSAYTFFSFALYGFIGTVLLDAVVFKKEGVWQRARMKIKL